MLASHAFDRMTLGEEATVHEASEVGWLGGREFTALSLNRDRHAMQ